MRRVCSQFRSRTMLNLPAASSGKPVTRNRAHEVNSIGTGEVHVDSVITLVRVMTLDVQTLMIANAYVALLSGAMLVLAWTAYRDMKPVLWWAGSSLSQFPAILLLAGGPAGSARSATVAGLVLLTLAAALLLHAVRRFEGRRPIYLLILAGPLAVAAIGLWPQPLPSGVFEAIGVAAETTYLAAAAWTIVRSRERLGSRWPLTILLSVHAATLALGPVAMATGIQFVSGRLSGLVHLESAVFLIGSTIFLVTGLREQSEIRQRRAASVDPLTGLLNRGSFFSFADAAATRCLHQGEPLSVVIIDLDRFKSINDERGHSVGDRVLVAFARDAGGALRPRDLLGRIGGEEFALVLPGTGREAAMSIAERIRRSFEASGMYIDGHRLNATLSAGVASGSGDRLAISSLLREADAALYEAKSSGRNRVVFTEDLAAGGQSRIVRVA